jgi:hypothetical protein
MKSSHWSVLFVLLGLVIGLAASGGLEQQTIAQAPGGTVTLPKQLGRYQISAYGHGNQVGAGSRGCYILDTATGEMWHVAQDGAPIPAQHESLRAYAKAGFRLLPLTNEEQAERYGPGDYSDTVVLAKRFDNSI